MDSLISKVVSCIKLASKTARSEFGSKHRVLRKDNHELICEADLLIKDLLIDLLRDTLPVMHEEQKVFEAISEPTLVIDPIDGTHNFISGLDIFGITISMVSPDGFHFGVISIPSRQWIIVGVEGKQTTLNERPIRIRQTRNLNDALICFDNNFRSSDCIMDQFAKISQNAFTTRITGCASYDGALIAQGLADARIWNSTKLFDFAALVPIIVGAGGVVTTFNGDSPSFDDVQLIASNGSLHSQLLNEIGQN